MVAPNPPATPPSVAGMIELLNVKKRVEELERQHLDDRLKLLESQNLAENLLKLAKAVTADAIRQANKHSPAWNWTTMSEEEAGVCWEKLLTWRRTVLKVRHPSVFWDMSTPCWYLHPEVVEELSALYLAWEWTFCDPEGLALRSSEYLDRWLPHAHARVKLLLQDCVNQRDGHKALSEAQSWKDHDDEEIGRHIQADLDARPSK